MSEEHDDDPVADFNAAAWEEQHRGSALKFPRVPVLDDQGRATGKTISPDEYVEADHKGKIGCPCCLAELIAITGKADKDSPSATEAQKPDSPAYLIQGTFPGQRHFKSKSLKNHHDACPFGHEKKSVRNRALKMLEFLHKDGPKRLNWNFNNDRIPRYADGHADVALKRYNETAAQMRQRLAQVDAIDPQKLYGENTFSIKTAREAAALIAMIRTMDDPQAVYESIDVISYGKALPLTELIAGEDWVGLGSLIQMREELGLSMPTVVTADTKDAEIVEEFAGYTFVMPRFVRGGEDANGDITGFRLLIATTDNDAAEALTRGEKLAVQGYAALDAGFANRREFQDMAGLNQDFPSAQLILVHVRKGDHVSPITDNFDTAMEDRPVYAADYYRTMEPESPQDKYDPDDPSTWRWHNDDI